MYEIIGKMELFVGFMLLAFCAIWILTDKSSKWIQKSIIFAAILWYTVILFFTPQYLKGWPTSDTPQNGVIVAWKVIEPCTNPNEAGIYLWMIPKKVIDIRNRIKWSPDPIKKMLVPDFLDTPRSYVLPYSRDMHKQLTEEVQKQRQRAGILLFKKRGGKEGKSKTGDNSIKEENQFEFRGLEDIYIKSMTRPEELME
jgi:hypothetical protein